MFKINDNKSIYVTRGDYCDIPVEGMVNGKAYQFKNGDVVRFKATKKKDCNSVVIQRDIQVKEGADAVTFHLTGDDTRIGEVISKPIDFWYEVELNPDSTDPYTMIGFDEYGAKILRLFPEGADVNAEDIEVVGKVTLQDLVDDALRQAKESGDFDGAPDNFGLGEVGQHNANIECTTKESLDQKLANGYWAYRNANVPLLGNIDATKYIKGHTFAYNGSCVTQIGSCNSTGGIIVRERYATETDTYGWSEWGWLNPAMTLDREYRTLEKWNGKAVYTALVDMKKVYDSGATALTTPFTATEVFDFRGSCNGRAIPYFYDKTFTHEHTIFANACLLDGKVRITVMAGSTGSSNIGHKVYVQVWYVKD